MARDRIVGREVTAKNRFAVGLNCGGIDNAVGAGCLIERWNRTGVVEFVMIPIQGSRWLFVEQNGEGRGINLTKLAALGILQKHEPVGIKPDHVSRGQSNL